MKRAAATAIAASLMLAISGCAGSSNPQQESTTTLNGDYVIEDSINATGQVIGQRAVMRMSKSEVKAMSDKEFSVFVDDKTVSADSNDADYLTIDFGDGTGIVFPSCTNQFFFYGELDGEGMMADDATSFSRDGEKWVRD